MAVPEVESKNIKAIYELVSGCLEKIHEKKCTFPNARIHAADARHSGVSLPGYSGYTRERMYGLVISLITQDLEIRLANVDESTNVPFMIDVPGITNEDLFHPIKKNKNGEYNVLEIEQFFNIDQKSYLVKEINKVDDRIFNHKKKIKARLWKEVSELQKTIPDFYVLESEKIFDVVQEVYQNQNPKFEPKNVEFFYRIKKQVYLFIREIYICQDENYGFVHFS